MMPNCKSVQLVRGRAGYGFGLSGQAPCCISCIVEGGSADEVGLRNGDCIIGVNGQKVYDEIHEHVVKLIGESDDILQLDIQEGKGHFSSSDDENLTTPPLYSEFHNKRRIMHKPPQRGRSRSREDAFDFNRTEQVLSDLKSGALFQSVLSALDSNSYEVDSSTASSKSSRGSRTRTKHRSKDRNGRSANASTKNSSSMQRSKSRDSHSSHKRNTSTPFDGDYKGNFNSNSSNNVFVQSLVAYLGTVEIMVTIPEDIPLASLDAIEACVQQLRREQHIHQRVVLKIMQNCVKLFNADGDVIAVYDGQNICFSSACPNDNRFFCIVTVHGNNQVRCHQFMVDPEISAHCHHSEKAKRFGIHCSMDTETGNCIEFPRSPRIILKMVEALFINSQEIKPTMTAPTSQSHLIQNGEIGDMSATSVTTTDSGVDGLNGSSLRAQIYSANKVKRKGSMNNKLSQQNLKRHDLKSSNGSVHDEQVNRYITTGQVPPPMHKIGFGKYKAGAGTLPLQRGTSSASSGFQGSQTPDIRQSKRGKKSSKNGEGLFFRVPKRSSSRQLRLNMKNVMSKSSESIPLSESGQLSGASSIESLNSNVSLPSYNGMSSLLQNAENGGRVASWAISFDKLLEDDMGLECFTEFLRKEFSQENILFWLECEKIRKVDPDDTATLKEISDGIFEKFLTAQATSPVNIDSKGQRLSEEALLNPPHPNMFEHQQDQIYKLMKLDSYSRFLKSTLYRQCLVCEIERMTLPIEQETIKEAPNEPQIESRHSFSLKHRRFFHRGSKQKSQGSNDSIHRDSSDTESLASFEFTANQDMPVQQVGVDASLICRLVLWDGSSTVLYAEAGKATIREALNALCERRGVPLSAVDIYYQNEDRALALDQDISVLAGQDVRVERRTLFRLDMLPIGRSVGVKAKPTKTITEVLKPVVSKYGLQFDKLQTWVSGEKSLLDISQAVNILDSLRICIDYNNNQKLSETNGKVKNNQKPRKTEQKDRENIKSNVPASSDTEDLINVMSAAQNSKMHDQRGLLSEMNLELPDFLKTPVASPVKGHLSVANATNNNNNNNHKETMELLLPTKSNGYPVDVPLSKGGKLSPNPVSTTGNAKARIQKLKHSIVDGTRTLPLSSPSERQKRASLEADTYVSDTCETLSAVDDDPYVITKWMQSVSCTPKYPYAPDLETTFTDFQTPRKNYENESNDAVFTASERSDSVSHDHRYTKRKFKVRN